ncbi:MAG: GxxExxY protein [Chitinophagaceae bacterium]|nr:MAG: GxxExxY protein [Chitinophagaceae bacterium]
MVAPLSENELVDIILDCSFKIHRQLGPGLLESVYEEILAYELRKQGLFVERQKQVGLRWEELFLPRAFRADLIVNHTVLVELKSVAELPKDYYKVVMTYLRLSELKLGLLVNFNAPYLKDGIRRIANKL